MKIARFRQPAAAALAVLLISGAGIAFAGKPSPAAPAAAAPAVAPAVAPAIPSVVEPVEPARPDTDTLQQGDQSARDAVLTVPVSIAGTATENAGTATEPAGTASEKAGSETEKDGAEEPGDANLPGGGHADDPNDPNADHQFEGVE